MAPTAPAFEPATAKRFSGSWRFRKRMPISRSAASISTKTRPGPLPWARFSTLRIPTCRAFRQRGGKLIMYFGWADPQLNPMMGVEYYGKVAERLGNGTSDFFRLFMVPGMFHCGGGIGTSTFDAATPLVKWVESANAPETITASRVIDNKVVRTRPLCPYPQVARYRGAGSIDEAANFACVKP